MTTNLQRSAAQEIAPLGNFPRQSHLLPPRISRLLTNTPHITGLPPSPPWSRDITMLLNADAPLPTVKKVLDHERLETPMVYTRLYDPTVASHYYRAAAQIEGRLGLHRSDPAPDLGLLLALVNSLHAGTLNAAVYTKNYVVFCGETT